MNWYLIYPIILLQNDINANVVHFNLNCDDIIIVMIGKSQKYSWGINDTTKRYQCKCDVFTFHLCQYSLCVKRKITKHIHGAFRTGYTYCCYHDNNNNNNTNTIFFTTTNLFLLPLSFLLFFPQFASFIFLLLFILFRLTQWFNKR